MRITDLLDKRSISLTAAPKSKEEALNEAIALMAESGKINDTEGYRRQVFAREELRNIYSNSNKGQRVQLGKTILKLENDCEKRERQIQNIEKKIRNTENLM